MIASPADVTLDTPLTRSPEVMYQEIGGEDGLLDLATIVAPYDTRLTDHEAITAAQLRKIAETKMKDLNADSVEAAMQIILGSAKSCGIEVKG